MRKIEIRCGHQANLIFDKERRAYVCQECNLVEEELFAQDINGAVELGNKILQRSGDSTVVAVPIREFRVLVRAVELSGFQGVN